MHSDHSLERIRQDFQDLERNPITEIGCTVGLPEKGNYYKWRATLLGPMDTPYNGGMFLLEILFPQDYPNSHPMVYFLTPIYHLNVNSHKADNLAHLGIVTYSTVNWWKPEYTIRKVLTDLYAIFYWPNPDSPYSLEKAEEYKFNKALFENKAKFFTKKYASFVNAAKLYDKDWDFTVDEKDLVSQEASKSIPKNEHKNYDDELINLTFLYNETHKIKIQCKLNELTDDAIKRFMDKSGLKAKDILFISNSRKLTLNVPIGDNKLKDGSEIVVIYDVVFA